MIFQSGIQFAARCALADMEGIMPEFDPDGDRTHPGWVTIEQLKSAIMDDDLATDLLANFATCVRDMYMGWPVKDLAVHPKELLDRAIALFEARGQLDEEMRAGWTVD